jgi:hypothetical protein
VRSNPEMKLNYFFTEFECRAEGDVRRDEGACPLD